jgi:Ca-activated chloride channel family protein
MKEGDMKLLVLAQTVLAMLATWGLALPVPLVGQNEPAARQEPSTIKVNTDLILLNVMVTDQNGHAISGLKKEDFKILEDEKEQPISFFSLERVSVSWGLVLDRSGSMEEMIRNVYDAAVHVVDEGTEEDEAFIVTFNGEVELVSDFVSDKQKLRDSVKGLHADGVTAIWDASAFALDHLKQGKHRKKVLVVVTDGEDNSSRLNFPDLVRRVEEEKEVLIYTVGMFESDGRLGSLGGYGPAREQLDKLAEATGARAHFPSDIKQCRAAMNDIAQDVSRQYELGYYPANRAHDGQWRKINVVVPHAGNTDATYIVRTRAGYYAPKN